MKQFLLLIVITSCFISAKAQEEAQPFVNVNFVIIQSTKSYDSAKATAKLAAEKLAYKLDLRELSPHKKNGLTFSKKACENEGGYPCYIARGRYDAGKYVSIEWSNAINGFAKGYYIVVVASGDTIIAKSALRRARSVFKDAYSKSAEVYIGCMH